MILQWVGIVVAIILVDLALSGDNALVIGAVASKLAPSERRLAIIFGGVMAIILRILLAEAAVFVLQVLYLQAIGGLVVFIIAVQLVGEQSTDSPSDEPDKQHGTRRRQLTGKENLLRASLTILVADVTMSLDNVLAVAALAHGNYLVLGFGIFFSMILLMAASAFIAHLIERFPLLLYLAGIILAWTAGDMVLNDKAIYPYIVLADKQVPGPLVLYIPPIFVAALVAIYGLMRLRRTRHDKARRHSM
jgi:YjbE family integral membrane protein